MTSRIRLTFGPAALFALLAPSALAQVDVDWSFVTPFLVDADVASWADLDGDGLEDLLLGAGNDAVVAWARNLGAGEFGQVRVIDPAIEEVVALAARDLDGDGVADVVVGRDDGPEPGVLWYRGLGGGAFGALQVIDPASARVSGLAVSDIDLDGRPDVIATLRTPNRVVWYPNLGAGIFGAEEGITTFSAVESPRGLAVADADADGDPDVAVVNRNSGRVFAVENHGGGVFGTRVLAATGVERAAVVGFGDFNGDSRVDLVAAGDDEVVWSSQSTAGGFDWQMQDRALIPWTAIGIAVADVDADGLDEILISDFIESARVCSVEPGTGSLQVPQFGLFKEIESSVVVADVNGDGLMDIIGPGDRCDVVFGLPGGGFGEVHPILSPFGAVRSHLTADVDGDGDLDVIAQVGLNPEIVLCERLSDTEFATPVSLVDAQLGIEGARLADLDGDGIDDLTFIRRVVRGTFPRFSARYCPGNGAGGFGTERQIGDIPPTFQAAGSQAIDVDADGDLDLLLSLYVGFNGLNRIELYRNDGSGQFAAPLTVAEAPGLFLYSVGDMDGDSNPDLLASTTAAAVQVFPMDLTSPTGFGAPTDALGPISGFILAIQPADFDVDGDNDLVIAISPATTSVERILTVENTTSGFATEQVAADLQLRGPFASSVDWDHDGDLDLVFGDGFSRRVHWFESSPTGMQPLATAFELPSTTGFALLPYLQIEDSDGDGDFDVWANVSGALRHVRNVTEFGAAVCEGNPNSAGAGGEIAASGTDFARFNQLTLTGSKLPPGAATLFLVSRMTGASQPPLSQGVLCLGGSIGRYARAEQIRFASGNGTARLALDLTMTPDPAAGVGPAFAGETLYFQAWYRDLNPTSTSNFTGAIGVLLR